MAIEIKFKHTFLLGVCASSLFSGCTIFRPETGGEVSIGRPQVFSRERLLRERSEEITWLKEQLDKPFDSTISGIRDSRRAVALILDLQANVNLAVRRQAEIDIEQGSSSRSREAEIEDLTHQIRVTELRKELDALKESKQPTTTPTNQASPSESTKSNETLEQINTKLKSIEEKLKPAVDRDKASGLFTGSQDRLINPANAERSATELSSRERFEDEAANRNNIQARSRDRMLDDTHDHAGFTLYELKFDAAITPGGNSQRKALVEIQILHDIVSGEDIVTSDFERRLQFRVQEDANFLTNRQYDRLKAGKMSGLWKDSILASISSESARNECKSKSLTRNSEELFGPRSAKTLTDRIDSRTPIGNEKDEQNALQLGSCLISVYTKTRLELALGKYFVFELIPKVSFEDGSELFTGLKVTYREDAKNTLIREINQIQRRQRTWVAAVDPKEYFQNISEVSSDNLVKDIAVSLIAGNGKGLSGSVNGDYFKQQQELLQAVRRQPVATSFHHGEKFGWVLGPKFEIRDSKPYFSHTTARYTFGATVVVPGWISELNMKACSHWIENNGERSSSGIFPLGQPCVELKNVNLQKLQGHRHIMYALMESHQDFFGSPEITMLPQTEAKGGAVVMYSTSAACAVAPDKSCDQTLVIEGRELWRNPEVYVGHQKADRVELLPSMRGVVATFRSLSAPAIVPGAGQKPLDLFVTTSAGQDRLSNAVLIVPSGMTATKPFIMLSESYIERTGSEPVKVSFAYETAAFPKAYAGVEGRLRKVGSPKWLKLPGDPTFSEGRLTYQIPDPSLLELGDQSADIEADLVFQLIPGGEWQSMVLPSGGRGIYLGSRTDRELTFTPTVQADFSKSTEYGNRQRKNLQEALSFRLPANTAWFFKAYPGLEAALAERGGTARITLQEKDGDAPIIVPIEHIKFKGKDVVRPKITSLANVDQTIVPRDELQKTYNLEIAYRVGSGEWKAVALAGPSNITVVGRKKPIASKADGKQAALTEPPSVN